MAGSEHIIEQGREIFKRLVVVENNVGIYPPKHPAVLGPADEICDLLNPLFVDRDSISFTIVNSEIYFERQLLSEESIRYSEFIELLMRRGINNLSFDSQVTPESIAVFFSCATIKDDPEASGKPLKELLNSADVTGISFEELVAVDMADEVREMVEEPQTALTAHASYDAALECMESVKQDILADKSIDVGSVNLAVSSLMGDFLTDDDAIMGLLSIKNYSEHLFHHSVNVALTSLLMVGKLKLPEEIMKKIGISGLLHDMGKLKIPSEIIEKPERLTEEERDIIETHPIEGARILMQYQNLGALPVLAAMEHHAHYDMGGYPSLKGKQAPHAIARIIAIADVYEAMTANRPYRPACSVREAMGVLMSGIGKQFDPLLLKLMVNAIGVFPPGSTVRLRTGQIALVVEANEGEPLLPKVCPINPATGEVSDKMLINTAENPAQHAVIGIADPKES